MDVTVITRQEIDIRSYWIKKIDRFGKDFEANADQIEQEISDEVERDGMTSLLGHLRLCGTIPEGYSHDSSAEKLYSKYTDIVIHTAYTAMGFKSLVLKERADVADVECVCDDYSFVADAKAFRLSRTAKNQKDFKIQAMDNWKHGKPFAMVVCPVYQLPSRSSQIYQQAIARSVCILTYTHLAVLVRYAKLIKSNVVELPHNIFRVVETLNPSKDAATYWKAINRVLLDTDGNMAGIWKEEKIASLEAIQIARKEALRCLTKERERIMKLSHKEAIKEVLKWRKIENRIQTVKTVTDNGLLDTE